MGASVNTTQRARPEAGASADIGVATLPARLGEWAQESPRGIALREKRLGRWTETSWATLAHEVGLAARWLEQQGVGPGDVVALLGANGTQWVRWLLAAQAAGALPTAVDPQASGTELESLVEASGARVVVADGMAQAEDAVALHGRRCRSIEAIVVGGALAPLDTPPGLLVQAEADVLAADHDPVDLGRSVAPDAAAVLLWTGGATGSPRGVVLTWAHLDAAGRQLAHGHPLRRGDDALVALSMAHAEGFAFGVLGLLGCGLRLHFPESLDTLASDLRALQPTVFVAPPRWFRRVRATIVSRTEETTPFRRAAIRAGTRAATRSAGRAGAGGRLARAVARLLVLRPLHRATGLGRVRVAVCAGGPLADTVVDAFVALGVAVTRVYGTTEACGLVTRAVGSTDRGVGHPYPGVEVQVAADGELLVRGPAVADRSLDGPTVDEDGWLRTGDVGRVTDGALEVVELSGAGDHVGATVREAALESLPLVAGAVAAALDGRWFALLELDEPAAASWARRHGIDAVSARELLAAPELERELSAQVADLRTADGSPMVDAFRFTPSPLSVAAGELTSTHKVRRSVVVDHHPALFKEMTNEMSA